MECRRTKQALLDLSTLSILKHLQAVSARRNFDSVVLRRSNSKTARRRKIFKESRALSDIPLIIWRNSATNRRTEYRIRLWRTRIRAWRASTRLGSSYSRLPIVTAKRKSSDNQISAKATDDKDSNMNQLNIQSIPFLIGKVARGLVWLRTSFQA